MHIKDIQINGFGNIQDKEIQLDDGLNIIQGKNESGKSTFTNFIKGMFYGVSKNKDGNKFSDLERYKPWTGTSFGGKLVYDIDNEEYSIFRDFNKNSSKVYDKEGNDITSSFNKDRSRGVEVGIAHLKIDEDTFQNSFLVRQSEVQVDNSEQRTIIQKLTNMIQLGEEGTSYEKTKSKLEKMLQDEVGTTRTQNKPINIVNREIDSYARMKNELVRNKRRNDEIENEMKALRTKQENTAKALTETRKVYDVRKKYETQLEEKRNAYETAKKVLEKEKEEYQKKKKNKITQGIIAILILFIIIVSILTVMKQYVYAIASFLLAICFAWLYLELEKKDERVFNEINFDITKEELNKKEQKELQALQEEGVRSSLIERKTQALKDLIDGYEKTKNEVVLEEHKLQIEANAIKNDVTKMNDVEEKLQAALTKKDEILELESSIRLAIDTLEESYDDIKKEILPEIIELIKTSVEKTTNGQYDDVIYNDVNGLMAKTPEGELIPIDKLSLGTIDQIYLGFRLAISNRLENIPLILDETFVYYDEERLENMLNTLSKMSNEKQIIILTCSNREKDILSKNKIKANIVKL